MKCWWRKLLNRTAPQKLDMTIKMVIFSMMCLLPTSNSSILTFGIKEPQHITNIHWKFEDFLPSSFQAIKVYNMSIRFKDGVALICTSLSSCQCADWWPLSPIFSLLPMFHILPRVSKVHQNCREGGVISDCSKIQCTDKYEIEHVSQRDGISNRQHAKAKDTRGHGLW